MKNLGKYVIGVDGGGTKTVALMADWGEKIVGRGEAGASNPNKVGINNSVKALTEAVSLAIKNSKLQEPRISAIYFGVAGVNTEQTKQALQKELEKTLLIDSVKHQIASIIVEGDLKAAFRAGTNEKNGVLLIAGTGSIAWGWFNGKEERVGGWGYLMGDEGGGYWLGQKVLQAVCRAIDGRGDKTYLTDLLFLKLGISQTGELFEKVYSQEFKIEELAPLVQEAAQKDDKVAREILSLAAEELALTAVTLIKKLGIEKKEFPVVLSGGVFKIKEEIFYKTLDEKILSVAPEAKVLFSASEPAIGAVKLAIEAQRISSKLKTKEKVQ